MSKSTLEQKKMPMTFGERLRALRKERGLSLGDLSNKSGLALSVLSKIENDKGGATVRTHRRIAEALDITLADLYRGLEEPEAEAVLTEPDSEEADVFNYDEKASAILLTSQASRKQMFPQLIVLQSGGKTALEQYRKGTERWILCEEGAVEAKVGEKKYRVAKGGSLYFKASIPHQFMNVGRGIAKIISVTTPVAL